MWIWIEAGGKSLEEVGVAETILRIYSIQMYFYKRKIEKKETIQKPLGPPVSDICRLIWYWCFLFVCSNMNSFSRNERSPVNIFWTHYKNKTSNVALKFVSSSLSLGYESEKTVFQKKMWFGDQSLGRRQGSFVRLHGTSVRTSKMWRGFKQDTRMASST